jgi:hypothetical protein
MNKTTYDIIKAIVSTGLPKTQMVTPPINQFYKQNKKFPKYGLDRGGQTRDSAF